MGPTALSDSVGDFYNNNMRKYGFLGLVLCMCVPGVFAQGPLQRAVKAAGESVLKKERGVLEKVLGKERSPYLRVQVSRSGVEVDEKAAEAIKKLAQAAKAYAASATAACRMQTDYGVFLDKHVLNAASSRGDWQTADRYLLPSKRADSLRPLVYVNAAAYTGNEAEALAMDFITKTGENVYVVGQIGPDVTVVSPSLQKSSAAKLFLKQGLEPSVMAYDVNARALVWKSKYWGLDTHALSAEEASRVLRNIFYTAQQRSGKADNVLESVGNRKVFAKLRKEYVDKNQIAYSAQRLNSKLAERIVSVVSFIEKQDPKALVLVLSSDGSYQAFPSLPGRVARLLGARFPGSRSISVVAYPTLLSPKPSSKMWNGAGRVTQETLADFMASPSARLFQEAPNRHFAYESGYDARVIVHYGK